MLGVEINEGGFGKIYIAYDDDKKVVKKCNKDETGINNLMEISIMSIFEHNFINTCSDFIVTPNYSYIYQNRAISDVYTYICKYNVDKKTIKKWCFSIALAIKFLHEQQIIHADIKTDNFLVFEDMSVKLTDFTFSIKKWDVNDKFSHDICTITHKPLEVIRGDAWDESVDIWALGCAFYEMYYGQLLFDVQNNNDKKSKLRCNNNLLDWAFEGPNEEIIDAEYYSIDWKKYSLHPDFYQIENNIFNDLILKMLRVNQKDRITIEEVLSHEFFHECVNNVQKTNIKKIKLKKLGDSRARIKRLISLGCKNIINSKLIEKVSINIFKSFIYHIDFDYQRIEKKLLRFAIWFASKIVNNSTPDYEDNEDMIELETKYCNITKCMFLSIIS